MCSLSNINRSDSLCPPSSEIGDAQTALANKQFYKDLIKKADSAPLLSVFKHYGLRIDAQNRKAICPFPKHKNGRESTPSLWYYPNTDTFWCFGCKTGVGCTDFVSSIENISRVAAAYKIIESYGSELAIDDLEPEHSINYSERLEILMNFSNFIRTFLVSNKDDRMSMLYGERITGILDKMNEKYSLENDALQSLIEKLKNKIIKYKSE